MLQSYFKLGFIHNTATTNSHLIAYIGEININKPNKHMLVRKIKKNLT